MNKPSLEFIDRSLCFLSIFPLHRVSSSVDFLSPFTPLLTTFSLAFTHAYDNVMSFISCIINSGSIMLVAFPYIWQRCILL
jgi:hypothetical protein